MKHLSSKTLACSQTRQHEPYVKLDISITTDQRCVRYRTMDIILKKLHIKGLNFVWSRPPVYFFFTFFDLSGLKVKWTVVISVPLFDTLTILNLRRLNIYFLHNSVLVSDNKITDQLTQNKLSQVLTMNDGR